MRSALDDFTTVDDQHLIGVADGGEAVGDHKACPTFHQPQQRFLQVFFGTRVYYSSACQDT